jgi:hypothetical protein
VLYKITGFFLVTEQRQTSEEGLNRLGYLVKNYHQTGIPAKQHKNPHKLQEH